MITLLTKDGAACGNAIAYGVETDPYLGAVFLIETDFGNRMKMTEREIEEHFSVGKIQCFGKWLFERDAARAKPRGDGK